MSPTERAVVELLAGLAGVRAVRPIPSSRRGEVIAAEERYEQEASLPIENLGIRMALARPAAVAVLKDASFRRPPTPTLYLVEEGEAPPAEAVAVDGRRYRIVGEEIVVEGQEPAPGGVPISEGFYLYPDRRSDVSRPSRFLLPPVPFPELETPEWAQRVSAVVSSSPSPLGDVCLRGICGFSDDPSLATLVVGFLMCR